MPRDSTKLNTDFGAIGTRKVAGGQTVHVDLVFDGTFTFDPNALYGALKTLYGAAKVTSDVDGTQPYGPYSFRVLP